MNPQIPFLRLSAQVYATLLIVYPAEFRRDYGRHMLQVFRDLSRDTYRERGAWGLTIWWAVALFDLLRAALAEHRKVSFTMSNFNLSRWAGWLCLFGGIFFAASSLSQLQVGSQYSFFGMYQLAIYALVPGMALITLGLSGMFARLNDTLNLFGRLALLAAIIGAAGATLGWILTLVGAEGYPLFMLGWLLHLIGTSVFGGYAATERLLDNWSWVLLPGSALPLTLILLAFANQGQEISGINWGAFLMLLLIGVGWMLTGIALNRQTTAVDQPTPAA